MAASLQSQILQLWKRPLSQDANEERLLSASAKAVLRIHRDALNDALLSYAQFLMNTELKDTILALHANAAANGESLQWPAARTAILENFEGQPPAEVSARRWIESCIRNTCKS